MRNITDGDNTSTYTYDDKNGYVSALRQWSDGLEWACDHTDFDLTTLDGIVAHKDAFCNYHTRYGLKETYAVLQPWRIVLWPWIVDLIISSPNLTIGEIIDAGILVEI